MPSARNGKNYTDMENELIDYAELEAVLRQLAEDFRQGYRDKLERDGNYTTRGQHQRLMDIPPEALHVEREADGYTVSIDLNDYWKYVENDTRPHWPPRAAILNWVKIKPCIPRPDNKGRIPTQQQLAFLVSRKIARVGTKGNHAFAKTQDALLGFYIPKIEEALGNVLAGYIRKLLP